METSENDPFVLWFEQVIELSKSVEMLKISTAYRGNWVDYYSEGLTPEEALKASLS